MGQPIKFNRGAVCGEEWGNNVNRDLDTLGESFETLNMKLKNRDNQINDLVMRLNTPWWRKIFSWGGQKLDWIEKAFEK